MLEMIQEIINNLNRSMLPHTSNKSFHFFGEIIIDGSISLYLLFEERQKSGVDIVYVIHLCG